MIVSPLVSLTMRSPHSKGPRSKPVDRITIHCVVGQASAESIGCWFQRETPKHSCNYGVGVDGRIVCCVPEEEQSICSSSSANDSRAITIEAASDTTEPYAVNNAVYDSIIKLCVDICTRYDKRRIVWIPDKATALAYTPADDEMLFTAHRWFANKSCPGTYLFDRLGEIADRANRKLEGVDRMYDNIFDVPDWAQPTVIKLADRGALQGDGRGFALSYEMVRILVMLDRLGVFDDVENSLD